MGRVLELFDSRLSSLRFRDETAELHFSYTCIYLQHKPDVVWSQEVIVLMAHVRFEKLLPTLPNTVVEGYLELDGKRYEPIPLPLPQKRHGRLYLVSARKPSIAIRNNELCLIFEMKISENMNQNGVISCFWRISK